MNIAGVSLWLGASFLCVAGATAAPATAEVPVVADVDVVVAGGGCGAVAAAAAAARSGARVFLAAPRAYLGEDVAGTLQLWLEPGEELSTPLARQVFSDPGLAAEPGFPYTYTADQPSQKPHLDTEPPSRLRQDRQPTDPEHQSVQYNADVTLTADLGAARTVRLFELIAFSRPRDFDVAQIRVDVSTDAQAWQTLGRFRGEPGNGTLRFAVPPKGPFRYARIAVPRAAGARRLLLGSLRFLPPSDPTAAKPAPWVRPLHVKTTLESALREAGVDFLLGCYPAGLLGDEKGRPAGLVIANRSGRQAVRAKVVIDGTDEAFLARLAGAEFSSSPPGPRPVRWVTLADQPRVGPGVQVRAVPMAVDLYDLTARRLTGAKATAFEYTLSLDLPDDGWPARARLEQAVRDATYSPGQSYAADLPFVVPGDQLRSTAPPAARQGLQDLPPAVCQPAGVDHLWVLGGCLDVPREQVGKLLRPASWMAFGERVGAAVAAQAATAALPAGRLTAVSHRDGAAPGLAGEVREALAGLRSRSTDGTVPDASASLPGFGHWQVVVVGGGTAGAAAGIAAAREGARTLVLEYLHGLGGVGTLGMIGKYWYGNRVGFAATVPENPIEVRMEFYRNELRKAGGELWFGVLGCGALVQDRRVTGVVVATPAGPGIVTADVVIDATGNADIAAAAGADTAFVNEHLALQAAHIPAREVGASYINGNRPPLDAADPVEVTAAMTTAPMQGFDRGQIVASRERRRIVGDYTLDWLDVITRRTFPDSIALGKSDYDSHGYQVHPYFMLKPARVPSDDRRQFYAYIPYRCLLPRGLDGLLVVGLGLSAHRDAMPIIRMQPDLQNSGYAAGVAAAMAARRGQAPRQVDIRALQKRLVETGILAPEVLTHGDPPPVSPAVLAAAVAAVVGDGAGLEVVMTNAETALPRLRAAHDAAPGEQKLAYALVLGVMGDGHGTATLAAEARRRLDAADLAAGRGPDGMDPIVRLLWALGRCGERAAVPLICELAERTAATDGTRFRAAVVSLGAYGDHAAAPTLSKLLAGKAGSGTPAELMAACALLRCGDPEGNARNVLERIANHDSGPSAELATQVLQQATAQRPGSGRLDAQKR